MGMLDEVMKKEGVSMARLGGVVGVSRDKVKDMRRDDGQWRNLALLRRMFWAMGYDLEFRLKKVAPPDVDVVITKEQERLRLLTAIKGKMVGKWDKGKMWSYLEMAELEGEGEDPLGIYDEEKI